MAKIVEDVLYYVAPRRNEAASIVRLPNSAHTSRPWRIHELTRDFRLEDVWALPTPGSPEDLPRLVQQITAGDTSTNPSRAAPGAVRDPVAGRGAAGLG